MKKNYTFIINKGIDGYYLASVPELTGVMTQAKNIEEIFSRVKEAIEEEKQIVIGKHSGSAAIRSKFTKEFGMELSDQEAKAVLERVREMSINLKRSLFEKELMYIYEEYQKERDQVEQNNS